MKSFLPAIAWSLVILFLSTRGSINLPQSWWDITSPDKFGHAFAYAVQSWSLLYAFHKQFIKKPVLWALLISISYGIAMEVIQYSFFPNRFFEVYDIIANISGSFIGLWIFRKWWLKEESK
ncbi:MAG: VanZ family protein [Saprospiraceae bacterium]